MPHRSSSPAEGEELEWGGQDLPLPANRVRVAIDARLLCYQAAGISNYIRGLIGGLAAFADQLDLTIVVNWRQRGRDGLPGWPRLARAWTPSHHRLERYTFGLEAARLRADLLHSPDFIPPLRPLGPRQSIITVHDLAFLRFPGLLTEDSRRYYGQVDRAVREADLVIAVSECTRRDLVDLLGAAASRVVVIAEAAAPRFRPLDDPPACRALADRLGLDRQFFLFVGTLEPRKNLPLLFEAYRLFLDRSPPDRTTRGAPLLAVAGRRGWLDEEVSAAVERLKLGAMVRFLGRVADDDLVTLYRAALAFLFPSRYEGFGLPALEAMACGTPVATADTSSLPEVVGEAGLLLPPDDPEAWASALARLAEDAGLRARLRRDGPRRAAEFSWERTARLTLAAYQRLAGQRR